MAGRNPQYSDAAGGVELPAILYFSSIHLYDAKTKKEAIKLLKRRWKSKAAVNWPGALAGYLIGDLTDHQLLQSVSDYPTIRERQLCKAYFYIGVKKLSEHDAAGYIANLKHSASSKMGFLEHEYYLSIAELDRINSMPG